MLTAEQMFRVRFVDQANYDAFVERNARARRDAGTADAYVSQGRWVADCDCHSGIACPPPEWGTHGACMECGSRYRLAWPAELARIEELLEIRPLQHRNWRPPEPVAQLERENDLMAHELEVA